MKIKMLRYMGEGYAKDAVVEVNLGTAVSWINQRLAVPADFVDSKPVITTAGDDVEVLGKAPMKPPRHRMAGRTTTIK